MTAISTTPRFGLAAGSTRGLLGKILLLAIVAAIAVAGAIPLVANQEWFWLTVLVLVTLAIFAVYLQPWHIPLKYIIPGTIFLVAFQVVPVVSTFGVSFTNFGDGHRGSKDDAITAIEGSSVKQVPGSAEYVLTIATEGDVATGNLIFLLYDPTTKAVQMGTEDGLTPCTDCTVSATGKVKSAGDLTLLNLGQAASRTADVQAFSVPTDNGAIKASGVSKAYEGIATSTYDPACDCITDAAGTVYTADNSRGSFVNAAGVGPAAGVAGQRRPQQLHPGVHRLLGLRAVPRHPRLELRVRHPHGRHDLRGRPAGGDRAELAAAPGAAVLPAAHRPALRHAVVRDAAGLAGHVQHRLRADQQPDRPDHQLVRQRVDRAVRRAARPVLARLPVHVPGLPGRAPVHPGGHDRGRRGRRGQAVPGIQGGGLPAAPGRPSRRS